MFEIRKLEVGINGKTHLQGCILCGEKCFLLVSLLSFSCLLHFLPAFSFYLLLFFASPHCFSDSWFMIMFPFFFFKKKPGHLCCWRSVTVLPSANYMLSGGNIKIRDSLSINGHLSCNALVLSLHSLPNQSQISEIEMRNARFFPFT